MDYHDVVPGSGLMGRSLLRPSVFHSYPKWWSVDIRSLGSGAHSFDIVKDPRASWHDESMCSSCSYTHVINSNWNWSTVSSCGLAHVHGGWCGHDVVGILEGTHRRQQLIESPIRLVSRKRLEETHSCKDGGKPIRQKPRTYGKLLDFRDKTGWST